MRLFLDLLENAALLMVLLFLQRFVARNWRRHALRAQVTSGLLFGTACAASMLLSFSLGPGIILDARTIVLSLASFFAGPVAGILAGTIASVSRLLIGGGGAEVGLIVTFTAVAIGALFHQLHQSKLASITIATLFRLGLSVHLAALAWFYFLPLDYVNDILFVVAVPYLVAFCLGTIGLGLLLREIERTLRLDDSEERYKKLFDAAAVAIWDEDLSAVMRSLARLRRCGVVDLRRHLAENPDLVGELAREVKVNRVNEYARRLFEARTESELLTSINRTFGPTARPTFVEGLCAIWDKHESFVAETQFKTIEGKVIDAVITMPVPSSDEDPRSVPVSILDISKLKQTERALSNEHRRLEEIIWGTNVATWEWNVQTGATRFNERWAEIVGYTLEELSPVSIETWERLAHPEDLKTSEARLEEVFKREVDHYSCEARMRHKNGKWVWVLDRGKVVEWTDGGKPLRMSGTHADITKRKEAEIRSQYLGRLYAALSECNAIILHCRTQDELFTSTCKIVVQFGGMKMAWIGMVDDATGAIAPVSSFGYGIEYLDGIRVSVLASSPFGLGPTGTAARENRPAWFDDFRNDPRTALWHERGARYGWRSSAGLPLNRKGRPVGVLTFYAGEPELFDDEIRALLSRMAAQISFALDKLDLEAEARVSQTALADSEQRNRLLLENSLDGIFLTVPNGAILSANPAACRILGRSEAEICSLGRAGVVDTADPRFTAFIEERRSTGKAVGEMTMLRADGSRFEAEVSSALFEDQHGNPRTSMIFRDITERNRAVAALAEQLDELQRWHDATLGREGRILELKREVNEAMRRNGAAPRYLSVEATNDGEEPSRREA